MLYSTKICQLLLPNKKAISLPIERKHFFQRTKKVLTSLHQVSVQRAIADIVSDFLLSLTHTHTNTHTRDNYFMLLADTMK